jgi:D-aminopeptidase
LNEIRLALESASSETVNEGCVGAGTGISCYGWKEGNGTASRVLPGEIGGYKLGALVQSNFGRPNELTISGVLAGLFLQPPEYSPELPGGSIMITIATVAPLDSRQLGRLCHRAAFGLSRTGSTLHGGSGDFVIAFSTAYRIPDRAIALVFNRPNLANEQSVIGRFGLAVIESVEEAIINSMLIAETVVGRDGNTRHHLPAERVVETILQYRRPSGKAGGCKKKGAPDVWQGDLACQIQGRKKNESRGGQ